VSQHRPTQAQWQRQQPTIGSGPGESSLLEDKKEDLPSHRLRPIPKRQRLRPPLPLPPRPPPLSPQPPPLPPPPPATAASHAVIRAPCNTTLLQQFSSAPCVAGYSYGCAKEPGRMWVSRRCRGRFRLDGMNISCGHDVASSHPTCGPRHPYSSRVTGAILESDPPGTRPEAQRPAQCVSRFFAHRS
jgi:hypothetical protein